MRDLTMRAAALRSRAQAMYEDDKLPTLALGWVGVGTAGVLVAARVVNLVAAAI